MKQILCFMSTCFCVYLLTRSLGCEPVPSQPEPLPLTVEVVDSTGKILESKPPLSRIVPVVPKPFSEPDRKTSVPLDKRPRSSERGRQLVRQHLEELLRFKGNAFFHQFGFTRGEPERWIKSVEYWRENDKEFSFLEGVALGDLNTLGLEYLTTKGQESNYTRYIVPEIRKAAGMPEN